MIVSRRGFIAGLSAATAGLALGIAPRIADAAVPFAPNPFIQIDTNGVVTIVCHRSEMGQGIRSSLHVLIADELGADPAKVVIVQGDGDPKYGNQNTDGSTSIRSLFEAMRQAGATARTLLVAAAAKRWNVPAKGLVAHDDAVHDPKRARSLPFGQLVEAAAKLPIPKQVELRPLAELTHVGKPHPLRDGHDYVTGAAKFAADVQLPGMLVAVIARPPAVLGSVARVDDSAAKLVRGVKQIVQLPTPTAPVKFQPLGGVAVIADSTWAALQGRAALHVTWEGGPNASYDSTAFEQQLRETVRQPGEVVRKVGDADAALAAAAKKLEAEYYVPHLVHAPMEPPAALARPTATGMEVWACSQSPQDARDEVAAALGIAADKVTMHVTLLGGGFGRKSKPDFIVEAALLARAANAPVRVQWTREDELRHAYYHTASAQTLAAGLDAQNKVVAWRHRVAYPTISSTFVPNAERPSKGEQGQGLADLPLAIPNVKIETGAAKAHVRIGWLRSVANIQQAFAVQSFIGELAAFTKRDHRDVLVEILGPARQVTPQDQGVDALGNYGAPIAKHPIDVARFHRVIDAVTRAAKWQQPNGRALGLAVHRSFLTYVAVVAHVVKGPRGPRVEEAWIAADAGTVINLERVQSQLEGAVHFGMSLFFHGKITAKGGAIEQRNFRDYRLVRMPEAPRAIHVEVIESQLPPGGIGEPGVPPVAPAIANAIAVLEGKRVRTLPYY